MDFEYEIDREKYLGREENGIPSMIKNNKIFSSNIFHISINYFSDIHHLDYFL